MGFIAIGDIHGCAETLDLLLDRLAPGPDDHLVFVGDYIDRGPDARGVIDRLLALREEQPCTFLRGNHEALMLDYLDRGAFDLWRANGGLTTLDSYRERDAPGPQGTAYPGRIRLLDEHVDFIRGTRLYFDTPEFFFVHAGLKPDRSIAENVALFDDEVFLWERSHLKASHLAWEKTVVCGHTPQPEPLVRDRLIAIDTGCVYHTHPLLGRLTAIRLPERELLEVRYTG